MKSEIAVEHLLACCYRVETAMAAIYWFLAELHKETTAYMSDAKGCIQGQLRKAFIALRDHDAHSDGDSDRISVTAIVPLPRNASSPTRVFSRSTSCTSRVIL